MLWFQLMVLMSLFLDVLWFQLMVLVSLSLGYVVVSADGVIVMALP